MINKKKTGLCLALAATLIASSALCGCQQSDSSTSAKFNSDVKDASKYTADENAQVYKTLDFSDEQEKEFAKKGFITSTRQTRNQNRERNCCMEPVGI